MSMKNLVIITTRVREIALIYMNVALYIIYHQTYHKSIIKYKNYFANAETKIR